MITLEIGIHGIPVTMDVSVYNNLGVGALNGYQNFNLDDRNRVLLQARLPGLCSRERFHFFFTTV
jgi:hypothetical protein